MNDTSTLDYPTITRSRESLSGDPVTTEDDHVVRLIGIVIGICDICLGTSGNLLTIVAILGNKKLQNTFHTFILCLCFVDLLTAAVMMPFNVASYILQRWPFGEESITCSIQAYSYYCCGYSSIVCLIVITTNRFIGVIHPESYDRLFTRKRICLTVFISWIFAPVVMSPFFFLRDKDGRPGYGWIDKYSLCVFRIQGNAFRKPYMNFIRILFQAVPLVVMIILYGIIFNTVRKCGRDVMRMSIRSACSVETNQSQSRTAINNKHPQSPGTGGRESDCRRDEEATFQQTTITGERKLVDRLNRYSSRATSVRSYTKRKISKTGGLAAIVRRRRVMDRRLLSISVTICGVFMILFLPSVIVNLLPCSAYLNPKIHKCASIITWLNSCVNPIIYCFMDQKLRQQYRHLLRQLGYLVFPCFRKSDDVQWNLSQDRSSIRTLRMKE